MLAWPVLYTSGAIDFVLNFLWLCPVLITRYPAVHSISMHQEKGKKQGNEDAAPGGAVPAYLLDREGVSRAKVLSNTVKQKRKEKAGKWSVPVEKVKPITDDEMFMQTRNHDVISIVAQVTQVV